MHLLIGRGHGEAVDIRVGAPVERRRRAANRHVARKRATAARRSRVEPLQVQTVSAGRIKSGVHHLYRVRSDCQRSAVPFTAGEITDPLARDGISGGIQQPPPGREQAAARALDGETDVHLLIRRGHGDAVDVGVRASINPDSQACDRHVARRRAAATRCSGVESLQVQTERARSVDSDIHHLHGVGSRSAQSAIELPREKAKNPIAHNRVCGGIQQPPAGSEQAAVRTLDRETYVDLLRCNRDVKRKRLYLGGGRKGARDRHIARQGRVALHDQRRPNGQDLIDPALHQVDGGCSRNDLTHGRREQRHPAEQIAERRCRVIVLQLLNGLLDEGA